LEKQRAINCFLSERRFRRSKTTSVSTSTPLAVSVCARAVVFVAHNAAIKTIIETMNFFMTSLLDKGEK
jgi:hypothetical protein